jgi:hypothetical protein
MACPARYWSKRLLARAIVFATAVLPAFPVTAADLYQQDGLDIRWDNTIRYSAAVRVTGQNNKLLSYPNGDDGDRNFAPGLVSNRVDLLSVLDISQDDFGIHASASAWYDTVYHARTDNNSPATYNAISVPNTQFPRATRNLQGQYIDLGDAFAYANFVVADTPVSVRLGRQTVLWGESLFFAQNGIAAAQAPVDYNKSIADPEGYSKDVFLPVNQLSLTVQPRADISMAFYYQLEWRATRLPGVGSYFSDSDVLGAGAERLYVAPGAFLDRDKDRAAPSTGQFGGSLHATIDEFDFGLYALKYNSKYPVLRFQYSYAAPESVGEFELAYPKGIELYGASFSGYLGDSNIAGEISARRHNPLVSFSSATPYFIPQFNNPEEYGYAKGDTLHAQISSVNTLGPGVAWNSADLSAEVAANYLLGVTQDANAFNFYRDRFAASFRILFEPHYFEVLPGLDLSIPLGLGYNAVGRSATDYTQNAGSGDLEIGISATYRSIWKASLTLTSFLGSPRDQWLADRDFLAIRIERTF